MQRHHTYDTTATPFYVCEREYWIGNGEDTPRYCTDAEFTVHRERYLAEDAAEYWQRKGWITTVSGPHYPETHYGETSW